MSFNTAVEEFEHEGLTVSIFRDDDPINPREVWDQIGTMVCWHSRYNLGDGHKYRDPNDLWETLFNECEVSPEEQRAILLKHIQSDYGREAYKDFIRERTDQQQCDRRGEYIFNCYDELLETDAKEELNDIVLKNFTVLPVYLYDHSGITVSTSEFSCPWDSGQVGYIYVSNEKIMKEFGVDSMDSEHVFQGEVVARNTREVALARLQVEVEQYDQYLTGEVYGYVITDENDCELDSCWGFFGQDFCEEEARDSAEWQANRIREQRAEEEELEKKIREAHDYQI